MERNALFPGSFDPVTLGHYDIALRASALFDKLYIALGTNSQKPRYYPLERSMQMLDAAFSAFPNIEVVHYDILTVDLCRQLEVSYIVRGIRNVSDFEFERSLAFANQKLYPELETVFFDSKPEYVAISSTIIRELLRNKADVSTFLPEVVLEFL